MIKDPWGRLLDDTSIIMLLRPRSRQIVASLRKKAADKRLEPEDYALVAHLSHDIPTTAFEDWDFLSDLLLRMPDSQAFTFLPASSEGSDRQRE